MRARSDLRRPRLRGFTLIEMAVVLIIVALLIGFAVPSFQEFTVSNRTTVQVNDLLADLAIARSEAVKLARRTEVRAVAGGWTNGWVVGTDLNGDGTIVGNEIVKQHGPAEVGFVIDGGLQGGAAVTAVAFGVTGTVIAPAGTAAIEFEVCRPDNNAAKSRGVLLNRLGRAETRRANTNTTFNC
jgi:prepilin-type N-terminal cleavage/methylation domain-containing protein